MDMTETSRKISRAMQALVADIGLHVDRLAGEPLTFSLIVYTDGRGSFAGNASRTLEVLALRLLLHSWSVPPGTIGRAFDLRHRMQPEQLRRLGEHVRGHLRALAGDDVPAFSLIVHTPEFPSYIGTASREDARRELTDLLAFWEADVPDVPAHEYVEH